jgi:hypothetical protein
MWGRCWPACAPLHPLLPKHPALLSLTATPVPGIAQTCEGCCWPRPSRRVQSAKQPGLSQWPQPQEHAQQCVLNTPSFTQKCWADCCCPAHPPGCSKQCPTPPTMSRNLLKHTHFSTHCDNTYCQRTCEGCCLPRPSSWVQSAELPGLSQWPAASRQSLALPSAWPGRWRRSACSDAQHLGMYTAEYNECVCGDFWMLCCGSSECGQEGGIGVRAVTLRNPNSNPKP